MVVLLNISNTFLDSQITNVTDSETQLLGAQIPDSVHGPSGDERNKQTDNIIENFRFLPHNWQIKQGKHDVMKHYLQQHVKDKGKLRNNLDNSTIVNWVLRKGSLSYFTKYRRIYVSLRIKNITQSEEKVLKFAINSKQFIEDDTYSHVDRVTNNTKVMEATQSPILSNNQTIHSQGHVSSRKVSVNDVLPSSSASYTDTLIENDAHIHRKQIAERLEVIRSPLRTATSLVDQDRSRRNYSQTMEDVDSISLKKKLSPVGDQHLIPTKRVCHNYSADNQDKAKARDTRLVNHHVITRVTSNNTNSGTLIGSQRYQKVAVPEAGRGEPPAETSRSQDVQRRGDSVAVAVSRPVAPVATLRGSRLPRHLPLLLPRPQFAGVLRANGFQGRLHAVAIPRDNAEPGPFGANQRAQTVKPAAGATQSSIIVHTSSADRQQRDRQVNALTAANVDMARQALTVDVHSPVMNETSSVQFQSNQKRLDASSSTRSPQLSALENIQSNLSFNGLALDSDGKPSLQLSTIGHIPPGNIQPTNSIVQQSPSSDDRSPRVDHRSPHDTRYSALLDRSSYPQQQLQQSPVGVLRSSNQSSEERVPLRDIILQCTTYRPPQATAVPERISMNNDQTERTSVANIRSDNYFSVVPHESSAVPHPFSSLVVSRLSPFTPRLEYTSDNYRKSTNPIVNSYSNKDTLSSTTSLVDDRMKTHCTSDLSRTHPFSPDHHTLLQSPVDYRTTSNLTTQDHHIRYNQVSDNREMDSPRTSILEHKQHFQTPNFSSTDEFPNYRVSVLQQHVLPRETRSPPPRMPTEIIRKYSPGSWTMPLPVNSNSSSGILSFGRTEMITDSNVSPVQTERILQPKHYRSPLLNAGGDVFQSPQPHDSSLRIQKNLTVGITNYTLPRPEGHSVPQYKLSSTSNSPDTVVSWCYTSAAVSARLYQPKPLDLPPPLVEIGRPIQRPSPGYYPVEPVYSETPSSQNNEQSETDAEGSIPIEIGWDKDNEMNTSTDDNTETRTLISDISNEGSLNIDVGDEFTDSDEDIDVGDSYGPDPGLAADIDIEADEENHFEDEDDGRDKISIPELSEDDNSNVSAASAGAPRGSSRETGLDGEDPSSELRRTKSVDEGPAELPTDSSRSEKSSPGSTIIEQCRRLSRYPMRILNDRYFSELYGIEQQYGDNSSDVSDDSLRHQSGLFLNKDTKAAEDSGTDGSAPANGQVGQKILHVRGNGDLELKDSEGTVLEKVKYSSTEDMSEKIMPDCKRVEMYAQIINSARVETQDNASAECRSVLFVRAEDAESAEEDVFSVSDAALRCRMLALLWALLGEARLREVGFPVEPVHRVLWRTVDVCCSVAGVKSAAAVPLPPDHDCGRDMTCFRDHAHRFLEVCAPTREHWKRFGWTSLTVDAVVKKMFDNEILPTMQHRRLSDIPEPVRDVLAAVSALEDGGFEARALFPPLPPVQVVKLQGDAASRLPPGAASAPGPRAGDPPPPVKKKRGRPAKIPNKTDAGRVERVMLWRFLLNLLEDPRNAPCIHWVRRDEGIFRIHNTDWLARLWGRRHGNPRMTYEKMARAMRTYYRSKVLQPVPRSPNLPRKLVYKFNPAVIQKVAAAKLAASANSVKSSNCNGMLPSSARS